MCPLCALNTDRKIELRWVCQIINCPEVRYARQDQQYKYFIIVVLRLRVRLQQNKIEVADETLSNKQSNWLWQTVKGANAADAVAVGDSFRKVGIIEPPVGLGGWCRLLFSSLQLDFFSSLISFPPFIRQIICKRRNLHHQPATDQVSDFFFCLIYNL